MLAEEADRRRRRFAEYRLPPGRHGISRAEVAENQRWRLLGAAAEVLAESGHLHTTSTRVSRCAGVSPATFYRHFENVGACLLASHEVAASCVWDLVGEACRREELTWPERLAVAVSATLRFLAVEPAMANLLAEEPAAGEPAIAAARLELTGRLAGLLGTGRELRPAGAPPLPPGTERLLVAGAIGICSSSIAAGDCERLPELAGQITALLGAPYRD